MTAELKPLIDEASKLADGLKTFSEQKVVLIRKDIAWTAKMLSEGKIKTTPRSVRLMIDEARRELSQLGILF